jgi:hypothetical protein
MTGWGSVVNATRVEKGSSVVVLGCGGVGLSVIQGAENARDRARVRRNRRWAERGRPPRYGGPPSVCAIFNIIACLIDNHAICMSL